MSNISIINNATHEDIKTIDPLHDIHRLSQVLKACADPLRVQILKALNNDTFGVLELTQIFETKQSGMSHHLKVLSQSGLVEAQREGNAIFYRRPLNLDEVYDRQAITQVLSLIDRFELSVGILNRISEIQNQRACQSQVFFARNADRFQAQQELIAEHSQYAEASFELLCQSFENENLLNRSVLEIGPGEGLFLPLLSRKFTSVIALDNSEDMLKKAKIEASKNQLKNIEFHLGDTQYYRQAIESREGLKVDAVVMNMVLHHVPTPSKVFNDIAHFLKFNGVLIICELSHHHQEWTKDNCGDIWLGFETEELSKWASVAGFKSDKTTFIGLRNGFQIQLRKFIKTEQIN
jgi:ubiquinone/menaquinone biosynthesis C-methylase UbiE/DNA-binding transcriptional ArsR family regulator